MILSLIFPSRKRTGASTATPSPSHRLDLRGVSADYGALRAVHDVTLAVNAGEIMALVGPSGSGKSTLLRLIAGIERPATGRIAIDGTLVAGSGVFVEPEQRAVGMVFQDFALFPHLTVAENVAFGLRGTAKRNAAGVVESLLDRLGLSRYARSYPHALSGGERQRVALARALAPQPRVLLMDEPFSSLDRGLREDVRQQTIDLLRETKTTTVIVTHEPAEAMCIADRIALLQAGRLEQLGTPQELYLQPRTLFAARFFSDVNELPGRVFIRPEHLRVSSRPTNVSARVVRSEFRGEVDHVVLSVDGVNRPVTLRTFGRTRLNPGEAIHLEVPEESVLALSPDHRRS